jgi:hypothetical protein
MQSPSINFQIGFMVVFLVVSLLVASSPLRFFRWLSQGRVVQSERTIFALRMLAILCLVGAAYRIVYLYGL